MFTSYPNYSMFRTLRLMPERMRGEDVYALQTAMQEIGAAVGTLDGVLGPKTEAAIISSQRVLAIVADGLAGGGTQMALTKRLADLARTKYNLPTDLVFGQLSHESSCRLGICSSQRDDGSYDAGVGQRNSAHYDLKESFTVPLVIDFMGGYLRAYFDKYTGVATRRRWALASGSWNAPAYAGWIANEEGAHIPRSNTAQPGPLAREKLEAYMASATAFMKL